MVIDDIEEDEPSNKSERPEFITIHEEELDGAYVPLDKVVSLSKLGQSSQKSLRALITK